MACANVHKISIYGQIRWRIVSSPSDIGKTIANRYDHIINIIYIKKEGNVTLGTVYIEYKLYFCSQSEIFISIVSQYI